MAALDFTDNVFLDPGLVVGADEGGTAGEIPGQGHGKPQIFHRQGETAEHGQPQQQAGLLVLLLFYYNIRKRIAQGDGGGAGHVPDGPAQIDLHDLAVAAGGSAAAVDLDGVGIGGNGEDQFLTGRV